MSRDAFSSDPRRDDDTMRRESEVRNHSTPAHLPPPPEIPEAPGHDRHDIPSLKPEREDSLRAYKLAHRTFLLRDSELQTMTELGTFRVTAADDVARFAYANNEARMEQDLRHLKRCGLVVERTLPISGRKALRVVALTKTGKRLLRNSNRLPEDQTIYHGIVRRREAKHDAELYRLFHAEAARIENAGGRPLRVVLDYELTRDLYCERARLGDRRNDPQEIERLAYRHGLTVVNGKIPLPDMRIEYQTADLELHRIDLELATHHYRPRGIAEKAKAGFSLYSYREEASRLRRILDEQELTAKIFAL